MVVLCLLLVCQVVPFDAALAAVESPSPSIEGQDDHQSIDVQLSTTERDAELGDETTNQGQDDEVKTTPESGVIPRPDQLNLIEPIFDLAGERARQGRHNEAVEHYRTALGLAEETLEPTDCLLAAILNNIGDSEIKQGRFAEAERDLRLALEIAEQTDDGKSYVGSIIGNLAVAYVMQGRHAVADGLLQKLLAMAEVSAEAIHDSLFSLICELAKVQEGHKRYNEAEAYYRRGLEFAERSLEPSHHTFAVMLNNIGNSELNQGRYEEAESDLKRALAIAEQTSDGKAYVRLILGNLMRAYTEQKKFDEAEEVLQRIFDVTASEDSE